MNGCSDESVSVAERLELTVATDALRRAGPNGMKNGVKELAALRGGKSGFGGLPGLRGQARGGEGFKGALRLICENGRAAIDLAEREGDAACVFKGDCERLRRGGDRKFSRNGLGRSGKLRDQTRRASLDVFALASIAEADLRGGRQQAKGDGARDSQSSCPVAWGMAAAR